MKGNARPDHKIDRLLVGLMRPCEGPSPLLRRCPVHPVPSDVGPIEWILSQADKADLDRANLKPSEINMERGHALSWAVSFSMMGWSHAKKRMLPL